MAHMRINNVNIYYEFYPCKKSEPQDTLVLIHGYLSSTFSFRQLIPLLTNTYTVVAFDLPGFGQSEKSKSFIYSMKNYGKLTLSFLQQMNIDQAVLVGHSMGGQIALQAAKQAPKHVKKLILLAASGYLKPFSRWLISLSYVPFFRWYVQKMFKKKDAKRVLLDVVYDPTIVDNEMINSYTKPLLERAFYHSLIRLLRAHGGDLPEAELCTVYTPALLLWGREDRIVPLEVGKRLVKDLPDASLKVYENTGHLLPEEKPKEVFNDIQAFLSS